MGRFATRLLKLGLVDEDQYRTFLRTWETWRQQTAQREKARWVLISRHPYDVIRAGYERPWSSCIAMKGPDTEAVVKEVENASLIAYEISEGDWNAENPYARIRIPVWCTEDGDLCFPFPETAAYGQASSNFVNFVREWTQRYALPSGVNIDELSVQCRVHTDVPEARPRRHDLNPLPENDYEFVGRQGDVVVYVANNADAAATLATTEFRIPTTPEDLGEFRSVGHIRLVGIPKKHYLLILSPDNRVFWKSDEGWRETRLASVENLDEQEKLDLFHTLVELARMPPHLVSSRIMYLYLTVVSLGRPLTLLEIFNFMIAVGMLLSDYHGATDLTRFLLEKWVESRDSLTREDRQALEQFQPTYMYPIILEAFVKTLQRYKSKKPFVQEVLDVVSRHIEL